MKITIVVPTIREVSFNRFLREWSPLLMENNVSLYVVEDNPKKSFAIRETETTKHFCWEDIDKDLGENSWIIPRRTDCVRSYGFWKAWKDGADIIISLDDDCYPEDKNFFQNHLAVLNTPPQRWQSTMPFRVRGIPYQELGSEEVVVNHGVWSNIPDLDAVTQLRMPDLRSEPAKTSQIMRTWFPMCGMNLAFKKKAASLMYFLLMGQGYPYDRYGDIWCGLFAQKIIRHLGWVIASGLPSVNHDKASNVFSNIKKEASGYEINEVLWKIIDEINLTKHSPMSCYQEISETLSMAIVRGVDFTNGYWKKLMEAQKIWLTLFRGGDENEKGSSDNTPKPVAD